MEKAEFRKNISKILPTIVNKENKSIIIEDKLLPICLKYNNIALYAAMDNEVNLDNLIKELLNRNIVVSLPKIIDDKIVFIRISSMDDLAITNKFNIREPINNAITNKNDIELFICPGLAFDKSNNRLGHGKGYYDKYLKDTNAYKIGVAFKEQLFILLPTDENDIKMDLVITD